MAKVNRKGRSVGGPSFIQLHHFLMDTPAWRSLSPAERVLYLEIARLYNGSNNGWLALSTRDAAERCSINRGTAGKAFLALQERGFIECVTVGGFSRKTRHASEWRLTMWPCDVTRAAGSKAFNAWRPLAPETGHSNADHGPVLGPRRAPEISHSGTGSGVSGRFRGPVTDEKAPLSGRFEGPHIHLSHRPPATDDGHSPHRAVDPEGQSGGGPEAVPGASRPQDKGGEILS